MKTIGLIFVIFLTLSLSVGTIFVEAKNDTQSNPKMKTSIKNDLKEIKKPIDDKTVKITSITKSRTLPILHVVGIEVCAGRERLFSPQIDLKSDMDSLTLKVAGLIMPNTCKNAEFIIYAINQDSIYVSFSKVQ